MTGYGEARLSERNTQPGDRLRALNNRYLKVSVRASEPYNLLEPEFEKVIRRTIRRGTVQVNLRCERQYAPQDFRVNAVALRSYLEQIRSALPAAEAWNGQTLLGAVLALPGVVPEPGRVAFDASEEWPVLEKVLEEALGKLQSMRQEEGRAMAEEFVQHRQAIAGELARIRERAASRKRLSERLFERIRTILSEHDVKIDRSDLIKEVAVFAERSDVSEEVVRLASHLDQFLEIMKEPESPGRKLEFLAQEMLRETNTIGSKTPDVEVSRHVVEIKSILEKIRELVQNVE